MTQAIVGTWYVANPGGGTDRITFTFLADGTFLVADKGTHANDPSGTSGLEWGSYTWNEVTGALSFVTTINTDGEWGLSHSGITSATVSGNNLTFHGAEGDFTVPRLISPASSVVGSWYVAPPDGGTDQIVFTFLADGTFLTADKGTVANDPSGTSGIEWGTYTWNPVSGAAVVQVQGQTDGEWGFASHAPETINMVLHVSGNTLSVLVSDGDEGSLSRLSPVATLNGTSGADSLAGSALSETLTGLAGNDSVDGGDGIDTVSYSGAMAGYAVTQTSTGFTVQDHVGSDGTDTLSNVERLQFSNMRLALDLDGNAGTTAKILGAVFGSASVGNEEYVGIGIGLLDAGMSYAALMQLALNAALGSGASNTAVVNLLYTNVVGSPPPPGDLAYYVGLLDSGAFTQGSLGVLAANTALNQANIHLTGLAETGIEYILYA